MRTFWDDADDECFHEEFEIDIEGCAHCSCCGDRWWPSQDEIDHLRYLNEQYDKHCCREERRERWAERWRRFTLMFRWPIFRVLNRAWPRKACAVLRDDEIPF